VIPLRQCLQPELLISVSHHSTEGSDGDILSENPTIKSKDARKSSRVMEDE
jgi:hypothetical protein